MTTVVDAMRALPDHAPDAAASPRGRLNREARRADAQGRQALRTPEARETCLLRIGAGWPETAAALRAAGWGS